MIMNKNIFEKFISSLKGQELCTEVFEKELRALGFEKIPNVSVVAGYRINEESGWVSINVLNFKKRITVSNNNIVIEVE